MGARSQQLLPSPQRARTLPHLQSRRGLPSRTHGLHGGPALVAELVLRLLVGRCLEDDLELSLAFGLEVLEEVLDQELLDAHLLREREKEVVLRGVAGYGE